MITVCPHCGTIAKVQSVSEKMYCPECGEEYYADSSNTTIITGAAVMYICFALFLLISGMYAVGFIAVPWSVSGVVFTVLTFISAFMCLITGIRIERNAEYVLMMRHFEKLRLQRKTGNGEGSFDRDGKSGGRYGR